MNAMNFATFRRVRQAASWAAVVALAWPAACKPKEKSIRGDRSVRPLDNLERASARNVSIETAIEAMGDRDAKKLKMLDVYVRNRAKTSLFSEDDLSSLALAIECLEGNHTRDERQATLDGIKSGKLKTPARELCFGDDD